MKHFVRLAWLSLLLFPFSGALAGSAKVLASVHPLALVAASVVPSENLSVLVPKGMTPHDFSLRPSDIKAIQEADIILWTGPEAEPYLASFAKRWPQKRWLDVGSHEKPQHAHAHDEHAHDEHAHGELAHQDNHWWFSPKQMIRAQAQLAQALGVDAGHFAQDVQRQIALSQAELAPVKTRGFFVFHQAYDYWVEEFGLNQLGAFTLSPERKPGAKTLAAMRKKLQAGEVACVFSEPEFSPALVDSVAKGSTAKRDELDPMAGNIALHSDGYVLFMQDLTRRFVNCLAP